MKIYLVSLGDTQKIRELLKTDFKDYKKYTLFSYMQSQVRNEKVFEDILACVDDCLLDSGAFTYMKQPKKYSSNDWDNYIRGYAYIIKKYKIKKYFELDIDNIVGLKKVEYYTSMLEDLTGITPIPVWHRSRGREYWYKMIEKYPYVAVGGIVTREILPQEYAVFHWFNKTAHKHGCKVHGLGFTPEKKLKIYSFDSVDSISWKSGTRYGTIYNFSGGGLFSRRPKRKLLEYEAVYQNIKAWLDYGAYVSREGH